MGTTVYHRLSREEAVERELRPRRSSDGRVMWRTLRRKWDGRSRLWVLVERREVPDCPEEAPIVSRYIEVVLISGNHHRDGIGIKVISDSMGPAAISAPLSWLREVTIDAFNETAREWYEWVRAYHSLAVGSRVCLLGWDDKPPATIASLRPLTVLWEGVRYRLARRQIDWGATMALAT